MELGTRHNPAYLLSGDRLLAVLHRLEVDTVTHCWVYPGPARQARPALSISGKQHPLAGLLGAGPVKDCATFRCVNPDHYSQPLQGQELEQQQRWAARQLGMRKQWTRKGWA